MDQIVTYSIGEPYPHKDHRPGEDKIYAVTDHSFFHIVYYCSQPELDSGAWQRGKLLYGLYIADNIPFFLVSFPDSGLAFQVTINAYVIDDEYINNWLNNEWMHTQTSSKPFGYSQLSQPLLNKYGIAWRNRMPDTITN